MIKSFPKVDFVVMSIVSSRAQSGKFVYELPGNVSAVYEAYLDDYDWGHKPKHGRRTGLNTEEYRALRSVVMNEKVDWDTIFEMFQKGNFSIDDLLMGADFLNIVKEYYSLKFPHIVFSDFLWTMRSIYLPLFLILKTELPRADIYHCVATGYAGVLGSMASYFYRSGLLISEHGIYTREREEELLKAEWVAGIYKNIWIDQFKKMSRLAYERADVVTSLYSHARELQIGLGCPEGKLRVTPNGIDVERLADLPGKKEEDKGYINIGAVLRVTPIKDVKSMIRAFAFAKEENASLKLWIMGPCDEDKEYAQECFDLVEALQVKDVIFTGRIDVKEYLGRMDFTILTSISEGQPLTILESYAAHKPVIATDVGNCRELIYGDGDGCGTAGILTHIMNVAELSAAMLELARSGQTRTAMGECGYQRVMKGYQLRQMKQSYEEIYEQIGWIYGKLWPAEALNAGEVQAERKYREIPVAASLGYRAQAEDGYDIDVEFGPDTGSGYDIEVDFEAEEGSGSIGAKTIPDGAGRRAGMEDGVGADDRAHEADNAAELEIAAGLGGAAGRAADTEAGGVQTAGGQPESNVMRTGGGQPENGVLRAGGGQPENGVLRAGGGQPEDGVLRAGGGQPENGVLRAVGGQPENGVLRAGDIQSGNSIVQIGNAGLENSALQIENTRLENDLLSAGSVLADAAQAESSAMRAGAGQPDSEQAGSSVLETGSIRPDSSIVGSRDSRTESSAAEAAEAQLESSAAEAAEAQSESGAAEAAEVQSESSLAEAAEAQSESTTAEIGEFRTENEAEDNDMNILDRNVLSKDSGIPEDIPADRSTVFNDGRGNGIVIDYENLLSLRHGNRGGRNNTGGSGLGASGVSGYSLSPGSTPGVGSGLGTGVSGAAQGNLPGMGAGSAFGAVPGLGNVNAAGIGNAAGMGVLAGAGGGNTLNNVINNAVNNALSHAINDAVNNAVNNALNNVDSTLNAVINAAVNNALNHAINNAVNRAVGSALDQALGNALNNALGTLGAGAVPDTAPDERVHAEL